MAKNIFRVPLFVKAETDEQLVKVMASNNQKYDQEFEYFKIDKVGSSWYAWFYASLVDVNVQSETANAAPVKFKKKKSKK